MILQIKTAVNQTDSDAAFLLDLIRQLLEGRGVRIRPGSFLFVAQISFIAKFSVNKLISILFCTKFCKALMG